MIQCRLCGKLFPLSEMSEEHYPAHSVGNDDIVALDIVKMADSFLSSELSERIIEETDAKAVLDDYFENELTKPLFPKGRTARTLCRDCNTFLGKYDEAYLKFFNCNGDPKIIRGFQKTTRIQIIKSIYGKFLSIPEAQEESFDFVDYLKDAKQLSYSGIWSIYFVQRDYSTDLFGLKDIGTSKMRFKEGVVYELSDDKFIFNLMNFPKHSCFEMTNIFDILNNGYTIVNGVGANGGYHAQALMSRLFDGM
ncbi:MAG: hypothetical protein BWZ04_01829 [Firmicutes bacterium ADurb.BinA205]|nr:MAG: hypothetical protein BWZ04_01829 [Firmicutes bacterium ADurb.BinA205]